MADFKLGRIKFKWRGDWAVSTAYLVDDIVKYGGNTYVVTTNHTSSAAVADFYTQIANFSIHTEGLFFKGDWAASTFYRLNDLVKNGAFQYRTTTQHTSGADFDPAKFEVYGEGFQFEDSYAAGTTYQDGDVVTYGGYTYVFINATPTAGQTPTDNTYWDVVTTGFKALGTYVHGTTYKTGDTIQYGGNNYVCIANHTNQYPAQTNGTDNATYWTKNLEGFNYRAAYNASTIYNIGDVVRYTSTSYVAINDRLQNVQPDSDAAKWQVVAAGDSGAVLSVRGDVLAQGAAASTRLPIGLPGSVLTNDGTDVKWGGNSGKNVLWVSPSGSDSNPGTEALPYQTLSYALSLAYTNSINQIETITGGTGGTPTTYNNVTGTSSQEFTVASVPTSTTFTINLGTSTYAHTYVNGGTVRKSDDTTLSVSNGVYVHGTGVITITTPTHGLSVGNTVRVSGLNYTCSLGSKTYPETGTNSTWRVTTDGSSTPTVDIVDGSSGHVVGNSIRIAGSSLGSSTALNFKVKSVAGDIIRLKNGTFKENLPLRVRENVSVVGESLRNTRIQPATGSGTQIATVALTTNISGATNGTYSYIHQNATSGSGIGSVWTIIVEGGIATGVLCYHGGSGFAVNDTITIAAADIGNGGNLVLTVKKLEDNNACNFLLTNEKNNIRNMTFTGLTGTKLAGGLYKVTVVDSDTFTIALGTSAYAHTYVSGGNVIKVGVEGTVVPISSATYVHGTGVLTVNTTTTHGLSTNDYATIGKMKFTCDLGEKVYPATGPYESAIISLDPSGNIKLTSPYIQNCTSINAGACGVQIDGNLHKTTFTNSYKSMLANDFTQINSDGIGVHVIGAGRAETVSVFCYYCAKANYAESGGFIRALNCSHSYGEKGVVSSGTDASETPVNIKTRGLMLKYNQTAFGGGATESDIENSITTQGSGTATIAGAGGATARLFRHNISLNYLHIDTIVGNFVQGEIITITKEDSSTFTVTLDASFGDSTAAQMGQQGPLIAVKSGTTALNAAGVIKLANNIKFTGDNFYYRVGLVSEENTSAETATIRLTSSISLAKAKVAEIVTESTEGFSNIRLTGHDFLNIGTGDIATTNYPGVPTQANDQADEVTEENGGRVYWVSTDQGGDFRVGDLFKIEQATGTATLNADAFDLSGLNELQLGSIGAELGATINEFSTDETLGGSSNTAIPTENAVVGYLTKDNMGVGHLVPPTGTTAERPTGGNLKVGGIRYNSTLITWEGYNGSAWTGLGGGNPWVTKTANFTAAANDRFFVNTTGGAITATLPASPAAGDIIRFIDQNATFDTNNLTVARNGKNIMAAAADMTVATERAGFALVYTDATNGWVLQDK